MQTYRPRPKPPSLLHAAQRRPHYDPPARLGHYWMIAAPRPSGLSSETNQLHIFVGCRKGEKKENTNMPEDKNISVVRHEGGGVTITIEDRTFEFSPGEAERLLNQLKSSLLDDAKRAAAEAVSNADATKRSGAVRRQPDQRR